MKIKVLRLGHSASVIDIPAGTSLGDAMESSDIPTQGYSLSINGLGSGLHTALGEGDVVTLVPKVEGGNHHHRHHR